MDGLRAFQCLSDWIREIRFVGADFSHIEPFGGVVQQSGQNRRVVDIAGSDFNGYDDIRLDATHDVGLGHLR